MAVGKGHLLVGLASPVDSEWYIGARDFWLIALYEIELKEHSA